MRTTSPWRHPNHREPSTLPVELRKPTVPAHVRSWIAHVTGAAVVGVRRLPGASSSAVHAIYLADGQRAVLRRYVWHGFLDSEPLAPRREVDALRFAAAHGLPVADVLAVDCDGGEIGDGIPALLVHHLPGRALADPEPHALAETLASIHAVDPADFEHRYFAWNRACTTGPPSASTQPGLWDAAIDLWHNAEPSSTPTFIHRDYHPGNVLWRRGRVTGVVDWANACRGAAGVDVATCRGNLVDLAGDAAADRFTLAYRSLTGDELHPYWELAGILEDDTDDWSPAHLAREEATLARAVRALG